MAISGLLKLSSITKRYDALDGAEALTILKGISLQVGEGESLSIVGPSGSGKSTLLQIIGTLDRPTTGQVMLGERDLGQLNDTELAKVRNHEIGFVFQAHYLLPHCTALENVLVPTLAFPPRRGEASETPAQRGERLLARVGLGGRLNHHPGQMSGGERQRVALVRALINQPKLLLADEPTGSLDHASADGLGELLVELNREEGVSLIVVTHAMGLAKRMARLYELRDGELIQKRTENLEAAPPNS